MSKDEFSKVLSTGACITLVAKEREGKGFITKKITDYIVDLRNGEVINEPVVDKPLSSNHPITDQINFFLKLAKVNGLSLQRICIGQNEWDQLMKEALERPVIISRVEIIVCPTLKGVWPYIAHEHLGSITMWIG